MINEIGCGARSDRIFDTADKPRVVLVGKSEFDSVIARPLAMRIIQREKCEKVGK